MVVERPKNKARGVFFVVVGSTKEVGLEAPVFALGKRGE